jgi:ubiquinone biosynthesis protein
MVAEAGCVEADRTGAAAHPAGHARSRRVRRIATVLARHGLASLLEPLGLARLAPPCRWRPGRDGRTGRPGPTRPERLRLALEELGATFVKLGQIASTRADLLPPEYQAELAKLQDRAPPVPVEAVRAAVAAELGRPVEAVFARFEPRPLAAASIGQVHAATLPDGTEVAVKVRRPGVVEEVEQDLAILERLAAAASRHWEPAERYDVVGLIREFAETLRAELDYRREGRNAERIAASFAGDARLHVPRVSWDQTAGGVLTLERLRGIKLDDLAALDAAGIDRPALAARAAGVVLKMVFEDGFYHADPHPGNLFVEPDGRIGLLDFGMVGTLDETTRDQLAGVLLAVASGDGGRLADALLELGAVRGGIDRPRLERDLERLVSRYAGQPLGEIPLRRLLDDALDVVRRHRLQLPAKLVLLLKTAAMHEALGSRLDPDFRLTAALTPYAERLLQRQYAPTRWARQAGQAGLEAARLGVELPREVRRLLTALRLGTLEVGVRPEHFEPLVWRLERLANRLVLGILAAAFVNGLAVLLAAQRPGGPEAWLGPVLGFGFALAAALGVYLAWAILRSGRA